MSPVTLILFLSIYITSTHGACNIIESGVSGVEQETIVDKHNSLRKMLTDGEVPDQPPATNMKIMVYDLPLAQAAQDISNTCKYEHVTVTDPRWWWVGQNLFMSMSTASSSGADWNGAIQSWFDEHFNYTYPDGAMSGTGHYTQVAWADSTNVGCGYTHFKVAEADEEYPYQKLYVCNYGPGGNVNDLPPYEIK